MELTGLLFCLSLCSVLDAFIFFQSEFFFQSLPSALQGNSRGVAVTGGGLVRTGDNVSLRLNSSGMWTRCYWFRTDSTMEGGYDRCSLTFNVTANRTQLGSCKPDTFKEVIHLDPAHPRECAVMLYNVTQDLMGVWAARMEEDAKNEEFTLSMASETKVSIEIMESEIIENNNITVRCNASGGNPKPVLYLSLVDIATPAPPASPAATNISLANDPAFFDLVQSNSSDSNLVALQGKLTAGLHLVGKIPVCWADQRGPNNQTFFQQRVLYKEGLDVHYKPRLSGNNVTELTVEAIIGSSAVLEARLLANPPPTAVTWSAVYPDCPKKSNRLEEEKLCNKTLEIGLQNPKYLLANISKVNSSEANLWQVGLTVQNLTMADVNVTYRLLINNTIGSLEVNFKIRAVLITTTSTTGKPTTMTPSTKSPIHLDGEKQSSGQTGLTILAIFAILGIITAIGIIFYRRRYGNSEESAPLTEQRTP